MKYIKKLVDELDDELHSAKCYAEKYVEFKAEDDMTWASKFKSMASDELAHASNIHALVVEKIESLRKYYTPPEDMMEKWEKAHTAYVEKAAWIKQMLAL